MYKLIHLHTDPKFFKATRVCISNDFKNVIIYLGEANDNDFKRLDSLKIDYEVYPKTLATIDKVSEKYKDFDGAVIYSLCEYKQQFLYKFPDYFKFFWFFFGYEIYGKIQLNYISKTTFKLAYPINLKTYTFKDYILRKISRIRNKEFIFEKEKYEQIYKKLDAILIFNEQEYNEISSFVKLPKLIKRTFNWEIDVYPRKKESKIIIGNSKAKWNNHADVFNIINSIKETDINYLCFFSYGQENTYAGKVRSIAKQNKSIHLIEEFLDREKFEEIYETASALVINSYRQHAFGNISTGIRFGCKVYLNPRNSVYKWLTSEGINISSIDSLKDDIKSNSFSLSEEEQLLNLKRLKQLKDSYTKNDFLNNIKNVLNE